MHTYYIWVNIVFQPTRDQGSAVVSREFYFMTLSIFHTDCLVKTRNNYNLIPDLTRHSRRYLIVRSGIRACSLNPYILYKYKKIFSISSCISFCNLWLRFYTANHKLALSVILVFIHNINILYNPIDSNYKINYNFIYANN